MRIVRAVEVGGSGCAFQDIDVDDPKAKKPGARQTFKTPEQLVKLATRNLQKGTVGIAYSMAGSIQGHRKINVCPNNPILNGADISGLTEKIAKSKSAVFNDMEAAVNGMAALFGLQDKYFMGITWSSGIGLRIWKKGEIVSPAEGGHMVLDPSPYAPMCGCGKRGHAEAIFGGDAVGRMALAEMARLGLPLPQGDEPGVKASAFLDEQYKAGERWARDVYRVVCDGMGVFLANIQGLYCLPQVVWKGGFAQHALALDGVEKAIRRKMREALMDPSWERKMKFSMVPKKPKDQDAYVGAAMAFKALRL